MPDEEYYLVSRSDMEDVADTIREAGGTSADLEWKAGWKTAIAALSGGGGGGGTAWTTIVDQDVTIISSNPNYFSITSYTTPFAADETYRVTWGTGGTAYVCETWADESGNAYDGYAIGNTAVVGGPGDGSNAPFIMYRYNASRLDCATNASAGTLHLKIEKQVGTSGGGNYQAKTNINPTTSSQTITADTGYDALSSVQINAMPGGSVTAPSSISGTGASVSTGTNTLTLTKTVSVTPNVTTAGYVSSGTAGNASVSLQASVDTQGAQTIHPQALADRTIEAGTYLTGDQTIKHVEFTNLSAENIKSGVTVKVGDADSPGCVVEVTGSYTGGASNFVTGTFTTAGSAGNGSVSISYSGSGYPVMAVVVVEGGAYVSGTTWYNSVQRYAVGQWTMTKSEFTSTPTYGTSGSANYGVTTYIYKNSTSNSTSYSRSSAMNTNVYSSSNANNSGATCVRFTANKTLSYYVNTSSYGLLPSTTYRYYIVYSS